ncbi:hypothetical protein FNV43_RR01704 [Rhamnella rubrinervis]|uniref:RNase H type-1 domain-containing protein n=1 Tax=Rhamnella rubrinervis TaxID=2594499 RepID=A0A8K0HQB6_9ROSA|nr:hypothetical protein FNV43_RR01704 [Rhamnella rubrinervis]
MVRRSTAAGVAPDYAAKLLASSSQTQATRHSVWPLLRENGTSFSWAEAKKQNKKNKREKLKNKQPSKEKRTKRQGVAKRCLKPSVTGEDRRFVPEIQIFWATLFYMVWQARCTLFFERKLNLLNLVNRFNAALEEFSFIKVVDKPHNYTASSSSKTIRWIPPLMGWIKVNVDAAYIKNGSAAAMVVRKEDGNLLLLSSTLISCRSPFEVELEALNWAASFA